MLSLPTFYIGTFAYIPTILFSNGGILCAITSYAANLLHVDVTDQNPVNKSVNMYIFMEQISPITKLFAKILVPKAKK